MDARVDGMIRLVVKFRIDDGPLSDVPFIPSAQPGWSNDGQRS
jgi:hypothetical protein